ncbi:unnamed protein product, partial [marine sediment metagenome]
SFLFGLAVALTLLLLALHSWGDFEFVIQTALTTLHIEK